MSRYYTEVEIPSFDFKLDYGHKMMFMGSCFAESVGGKLADLRFKAMINPFGILYNPLSVAKGIEDIVDGRQYTDDDLFEHEGMFKCLDFHSRYSASCPTRALKQMNGSVQEARAQLKDAKVLFITFGSAWVYEHLERQQVVANCHKLKNTCFTRRRLYTHEIVELYTNLLRKLAVFNAELNVVFTVSPIRHWKDGAHGNQLSKATLLLAIDELLMAHKHCSYFPSYEIVLDELRDYRFYAEDMLHMSPLAVTHIWEKLAEVVIAPKCKQSIKDMNKLNKAMNHRVQNRQSASYQSFVAANIKLIEKLKRENVGIDLSREMSYFLQERENN